MKTPKTPGDAGFLEKQRQALLRLRETLLAATQSAEASEADVREERAGTAGEYEDEGQELDELERDGNLVVRHVERLERVDRALKKIEEGTYGLSDESGEAIPRARLEAAPESLYTLSEERAHEAKR